uniref:Uncharacterized protein n=1 Tax=Tetradesmus obliquus TaxID=3088 RepID=A0A383W0U8_TETOB|eukprot:jgi/Sobl393_1/14994/SZX70723.1
MGAGSDPSNKDTTRPILDTFETLRCRKNTNGDSIAADCEPTSPVSPLSPSKRPLTNEEIDAAIAKLPRWQDQLTLRGLISGSCLGLLFAIITLKLSLGSAGIIPGLGIPAGLISFALIRAWTLMGQGLKLDSRAPWLHKMLFQHFSVQENAVLQTFICSISGVAFTGGFGTYLTGMSYQASLNLGGPKHGDPDFNPDVIFDPELHRIIPYLLLTAVLGVFMLTQLRKLMIIDWRLPFPSGTASGIMMSSFHTAKGEADALRKVRVLSWTGAGSFFFSVLKWLVNGSNYECGFGSWPSFGFKAQQYTWFFDWQHNYIGAGMICPHIVNWSMLLGAILSWGIMWPLMEKREGDWFPAGLGKQDFRGLFGYKVFLTIAILMGEGMYMVLRVLISSSRDAAKRLKEARQQARQSQGGSRSGLPRFTRSLSKSVGKLFLGRTTTQGEGTVPLDFDEDEDVGIANTTATMEAATTKKSPLIAPDSGAGHHHIVDNEQDTAHLLEFKETPNERRLRTEVFLREVIPWWLAPVGYGGLGVLSTIFIPLIYPPVKWYFVAVAYIISPIFALPNSYGTGLTDWDNCSMYGKLMLFIFAAWAGAAGNGIIVGLAICGVMFATTSSAATLMGDFRTGYITLTAPRAMFVAQLVGQLLGAVLAPVAFMLFWGTGQVNVPQGPYPAPFSTIYRGMGLIGTEGFSALPKHCGTLMLAFFVGGMLLCLARDLLPKKVGRFVPSPMAMGLPFYIGAASALDFWAGSLINHAWEYFDPEGATELGPIVGAGLLVGDGIWAIPSSLIAIFGKAPPICMGFYGKPLCKLPYCMGFWLGGSERIPS